MPSKHLKESEMLLFIRGNINSLFITTKEILHLKDYTNLYFYSIHWFEFLQIVHSALFYIVITKITL